MNTIPSSHHGSIDPTPNTNINNATHQRIQELRHLLSASEPNSPLVAEWAYLMKAEGLEISKAISNLQSAQNEREVIGGINHLSTLLHHFPFNLDERSHECLKTLELGNEIIKLYDDHYKNKPIDISQFVSAVQNLVIHTLTQVVENNIKKIIASESFTQISQYINGIKILYEVLTKFKISVFDHKDIIIYKLSLDFFSTYDRILENQNVFGQNVNYLTVFFLKIFQASMPDAQNLLNSFFAQAIESNVREIIKCKYFSHASQFIRNLKTLNKNWYEFQKSNFNFIDFITYKLSSELITANDKINENENENELIQKNNFLSNFFEKIVANA